MKTNVPKVSPEITTHEGAKAARINPEQQLRRSVLACMLFEGTFYESGEDIADRIKSLIQEVSPAKVAAIAVEARTAQKLRHVPLLVVRQMAALPSHRSLVSETLAQVIQRPDELGEFMAIYWKDGKCPVAAQVKKGLEKALAKFDEYSLAKYNRDAAVKLKDVLFICHGKPVATGESRQIERKYLDKKTGKETVKKLDRHDGSLYGKLVAGTLATPDTWEVALSGGADKKEAFTRLLNEDKLGALAFIRNLRNMKESGVDEKLVMQYSQAVKIDRVLPFRFIAAARHVPQWEPMIEAMMFRCLEGAEKLPGKTAIVVDNSGSMRGPKISAKSEIDRSDAACALAILIREIAETPLVIGYGTEAKVVPARRGFALRDAIQSGPGGGTDTAGALKLAAKEGYDRIIVVTDEQSHTVIGDPLTSKGYFVNVSVNKNGIGYGKWTHIDGWSESIIEYIRAAEQPE